MEAYCVKCKTKREIKSAEAVYTKAGTPGTKGHCSVCNTKVFLMGRSEAHAHIPPPQNVKRKKRKKPIKRSGKLVIVESPAKARTVGRFLGKGYTVKASVGHVRDLLRSQLSVDVDNGFTPKYRVPNEKKAIVKELKDLVQRAEAIYLATDLDREGEAIAWHLIHAAEIPPELTHRVIFHEITRPAIDEAFANPRELNMCLVDAQQGRRILDRLVGYSLTPLLWKKVRGRLSAGRVQSVTLRLIVEREREIDAFVPVEYWTIQAEFQPEGKSKTFIAKLVKVDGEEPALNNESQVLPITTDMESVEYKISKIKRGTRKRNPSAPFTTSTMQQDAARRLGFSARKTMRIAQQLYEGIDVSGRGATGLITYMRTDSTNTSQLARQETKEFVEKTYGEQFLPKKPHVYKSKTKRAQEAHEAIRPTSVSWIPASIKAKLSRDQNRLYRLIWQRFVASQMASAVYDTLSVEISGKSASHEYLLRTSGSTLRFPGFLKVYSLSKDNDGNGMNENVDMPVDMHENQGQKLIRLLPEQHFTKPPPRFSEASLIRTLEENGIGRPSTYAPIISTLNQRGYIFREEKRIHPAEIGLIVNDLLIDHFPDVLDVSFTAKMESELDRVATGEQSWIKIVEEFYEPFSKQVELANEKMPEVKTEPEKIGRSCPLCNHDLIIRWGRHGKFIGCSNFPECRHTEPFLEKINVICPQDGGDLVERKTRKGRTFYGCANYPECDFTSWNRPLTTPCPHCGGLLVASNKRHAKCIKCEQLTPIDQISVP